MAFSITQEQWAEMTETLQTAAQRVELWIKEREGLAAMLGEAKEALAAAQNDAQAADQRSRELMGLYGWAGGTGGTAGGGSSSKVEIFQDPGCYSSFSSLFHLAVLSYSMSTYLER